MAMSSQTCHKLSQGKFAASKSTKVALVMLNHQEPSPGTMNLALAFRPIKLCKMVPSQPTHLRVFQSGCAVQLKLKELTAQLTSSQKDLSPSILSLMNQSLSMMLKNSAKLVEEQDH